VVAARRRDKALRQPAGAAQRVDDLEAGLAAALALLADPAALADAAARSTGFAAAHRGAARAMARDIAALWPDTRSG